MEIKFNIKKRYGVLAFLLAFYSAFGMCQNIQKTGVSKILKRFEKRTFLTDLYANLIVGMKNSSYMAILFGLAAIVIFFVYCFVFTNKYRKREYFFAALLAFLYSFSIWLGLVFSKNETWNGCIKNIFVKCKSFLFLSGWFFLFFGLILVLTELVKKYEKSFSQERSCTLKSIIRVFLLTSLGIFLMWLPYIIIFRPAVIHGDVMMQLCQYYHIPVKFQGRWASDGVNIVFSNDHPFIQTILFGKIVDLGLKINNLHFALGIYGMGQMLCFLFGYAGIISTFYYFGMKKRLLVIISLIYGLVPIFPMYSFYIGGDASLGLVFIYFMLTIIWLYKTDGAVLSSKRFILCQFLAIFSMAIIKNQGVYIVIFTIIIAMIIYRKYWKQCLIAMVLPLFIFYIGYQGFLFNAMKVGDVGKQEALSLVFQQTARTIKLHEKDVTEEEKAVIDKVLDYQLIKEKYDPNLSDPVKKTFREDSTSDDLKAYFSTWFHMGLRHPGEYVQSFFASTWKYYSPLCTDTNIYYYGLATMKVYAEQRAWTTGVVPDDLIKKLDWTPSVQRKAERELANYYLFLTKYIPGLNWFVLPGYVGWLIFLCFYLMFVKKDYQSMVIYFPVFLVFGVCLLSPVNGNVRYFLPAYCMLPSMIAVVLGGKKVK